LSRQNVLPAPSGAGFVFGDRAQPLFVSATFLAYSVSMYLASDVTLISSPGQNVIQIP
jgi:hypothetical protein